MTIVASEFKTTVLPTPGLPGSLIMHDPIYDGPLSANYKFYWKSPKNNVYYLASVIPSTMSDELMNELVPLLVDAIKRTYEAENI